MKLGFLDLLGDLEHTIELIGVADAAGLTRYWLTEFPPQPSPMMLLGTLAGLSDRISVGTAAILFSYYAPRRTAHDYQLLERLYEGRIDAGVASSTALPRFIADDLEDRDPAKLAAAYPARFATFLHHLRNTPGNPAYDRELAWSGAAAEPPRVWSLGSGRAAELAAGHGTGFGYPLMYSGSVDDPQAMQRYVRTFTPNPFLEQPRRVLAVSGYCGATDEQARAVAESWGIFTPHVIGSPATCFTRLAALRDRYDADEIIWGDMNRVLAARRAAIEALAALAR
ncbi:MAG: LLM class flavin-dependent oxidoreductase [Deltaproteobacteria bacterium]|nr:LLM class flavin-dependent oxidoreductase [Deltaproteobacteria bacterium]